MRGSRFLRYHDRPYSRRLFNAARFTPDTTTRTGAKVDPRTGQTLAANQIATRPIRAGSRLISAWLADAGATNLVPSPTTSDYLTSNTLTGLSRTLVEDSTTNLHKAYGATVSLVSGTTYWLTAHVQRGSGTRNAAVYVDCTVPAQRAGFVVDLSTGVATAYTLNGGVVTNLASQASGSGWLVRCQVSHAAWNTAVVVQHRLTISGTTVDSYAGNGTSSVTFTGVTLVAAANTAPPPLIGEASSVTADAISISAGNSPFPTSYSQPFTVWWGVILEGHSIGATGHVTAVPARQWDVGVGQQTVWYANSGDRQVTAQLGDSAGVQTFSSATGVAADTANVLAVYALTFTPGVAWRLYRNGVKIAEKTTGVGASINAWGAIFLGNVSTLIRPGSLWCTDPLIERGTARSDPEIAAGSQNWAAL